MQVKFTLINKKIWEKRNKSLILKRLTQSLKQIEKTLLDEEIENDKWYTVEEAIQFIENNVRELYKVNGKL